MDDVEKINQMGQVLLERMLTMKSILDDLLPNDSLWWTLMVRCRKLEDGTLQVSGMWVERPNTFEEDERLVTNG